MSLDFLKNGAFIHIDPTYEDCELIQFRLTDSALRDIEQSLSSLGQDTLKLCIKEDQQSLTIPLENRRSKFTFSIANLNAVSDGSLDGFRIKNGTISRVGKANKRITINAKEDSFSMARERMVQLEDESRKQKTKELNSNKQKSHRNARKVKSSNGIIPSAHRLGEQRSAAQDAVIPSNRISPSSYPIPSSSPIDGRPSPPLPNRAVAVRSLRERVIHILALRPYGKPELLCRLARDGLSQNLQDELDDLLAKITQTVRGSAYSLLASVFTELDPLWPGYSAAEKSRVVALKASKRMQQQRHTSPCDDSPGGNRGNNTRSHITASPANGLPTASSANAAQPRPDPDPASVEDDEDQFARRPTRASAPVAPHPLSKKIAALELLSCGIEENKVALRIGVSRELLRQWRENETVLRERYNRQNSNAAASSGASQPTTIAAETDPLPPSDSTQSTTNINNNKCLPNRTTLPTVVTPPIDVASRISPSKRARVDSAAPRADSITAATTATLPPSARSESISKSRSRAQTMSKKPTSNQSIPDDRLALHVNALAAAAPPPPLGGGGGGSSGSDSNTTTANMQPSPSSLRDSFRQTFYGQSNRTSHHQHPLNNNNHPHNPYSTSGMGAGSEGESAPHTPCSVVSSGGSVDMPLTAGGQMHLLSSVGTAANAADRADSMTTVVRGSSVNVNGAISAVGLGAPTNMSAAIGARRSCDLDELDDHMAQRAYHSSGNTGPSNRMRSNGLLDHAYDYGDPTRSTDLQLTKINTLYPVIRTPEQAEHYRAEFQSTYPTYLRMYYSFMDIMNGIDQVHSRLSAVADTEGWDGQLTTRLSDQLNELLQRTRTSKYRDDSLQLTLIVHKVRLLKRRLRDFTHSWGHQRQKQQQQHDRIQTTTIVDPTRPSNTGVTIGRKRKSATNANYVPQQTKRRDNSTNNGVSLGSAEARSATAVGAPARLGGTNVMNHRVC